MITKLDRYIASTIIRLTLVVLLILIGVQLFISLLNELSDIGTGNFGILQAFVVAFLDLPINVYLLFPMACLMGSLLGLGLLATHSELPVMRTTGMSFWRITAAVIIGMVVMLFFVTLIGEGLAPKAEHLAQTIKMVKMSQGQILPTQQGLWLKTHDSFAHLGDVIDKQTLADIQIYRFDSEERLQTLLTAKAAKQIAPGNWTLQQVTETTFPPDQKALTTAHLATENWAVTLNPFVLRLSQADPTQMTLPALYHAIHAGVHARRFAYAFWQRSLQPLASIMMVVLAIAFVFGPLANVSMGLRLLTGIIIGFFFYMANQFAAPVSVVYQLPPLLAAALPIALLAFLSTVLIWRIR